VLIRSEGASLVEVTGDSVVDLIAASGPGALLCDCTLDQFMSLLRGAEVDEVVVRARRVHIRHVFRDECLRVLLEVQIQVGIVNRLLLFRRHTRLRTHDLSHVRAASTNSFDTLSEVGQLSLLIHECRLFFALLQTEMVLRLGHLRSNASFE